MTSSIVGSNILWVWQCLVHTGFLHLPMDPCSSFHPSSPTGPDWTTSTRLMYWPGSVGDSGLELGGGYKFHYFSHFWSWEMTGRWNSRDVTFITDHSWQEGRYLNVHRVYLTLEPRIPRSLWHRQRASVSSFPVILSFIRRNTYRTLSHLWHKAPKSLGIS